MSQIILTENGSAPATPASGRSIIYPKADGLWYSKDDAGVETLMSSGGGITQLTGDVTAGPGTGSQAATLSNTGVAAATYGDATHVGQFAVNAKGRITSASNVAITDTGITQLTGDVTAGPGSGSQASTIANLAVTTAKLAANAVTFAKLVAASAASILIGRQSGSAGDYQEITLGSGLSMSGTTLSATGTGGTVTTTGSPASGNLTKFSGASSITNTDLTGDVTTSGTLAATVEGIALVDDGNSGTTKTIDWGSLKFGRHKLTLTGNVTLTLSNPVSGATYVLALYTGSGSFAVTWPGTVKWPAGIAPVITTTASRMDLVVLFWDGTDYFGSFNQNYTP